MAASPVMSARRLNMVERGMVEDLNTRFTSFVDQLHTLKDQSKKLKDNTFIAHTQALENQLGEMQHIYENKINDLSFKLEDCIAQRNKAELDSNKYKALYQEFETKFKDETVSRKKLENALADAHRLLSEKDSCIQDCRITIAQHQNAHIETTKERDNLQSMLTDTQITADNETARRKDLEEQCRKLQDEMDFRSQIHEKELTELNNKLAAAERCIELADDELKKHQDVDDNLANMIAKMRVQTQNEFQRYQNEADAAFQAACQDLKSKTDAEIQRRVQAEDETIQCKAIIEELNAKLANTEAKAGALEDQNRSLINTLQVERKDAANGIQNLEERVHDLQQKLHDNRHELTAVQNSTIPFDHAIQGLNSLLEAEEKRLSILMTNPNSELYQNSRGELLSSRKSFTGRRSSMPGSPGRLSQAPNTSGTSRSKGSPVPNLDVEGGKNSPTTDLPPLKNAPAPTTKYWNPKADSPRRSYHSHSGNIQIAEVSPTGLFIKIQNTCANQDVNIGGYVIQQNRHGKPVALFRYPPRTILKSGFSSTAISWATSNTTFSAKKDISTTRVLTKDENPNNLINDLKDTRNTYALDARMAADSAYPIIDYTKSATTSPRQVSEVDE